MLMLAPEDCAMISAAIVAAINRTADFDDAHAGAVLAWPHRAKPRR
jgi:hypothetical protein